MAGRRVERLNEQVKREVADILRTRVKDPRVGIVSVTGARVSRDLSVATVYVVPSGDPDAQRQTLEGLSAAAPYIRNEIGERLRLRKLPEVRFLRDTSFEHAHRIEQLLHEMRPPAANGPESEPDED